MPRHDIGRSLQDLLKLQTGHQEKVEGGRSLQDAADWKPRKSSGRNIFARYTEAVDCFWMTATLPVTLQCAPDPASAPEK